MAETPDWSVSDVSNPRNGNREPLKPADRLSRRNPPNILAERREYFWWHETLTQGSETPMMMKVTIDLCRVLWSSVWQRFERRICFLGMLLPVGNIMRLPLPECVVHGRPTHFGARNVGELVSRLPARCSKRQQNDKRFTGKQVRGGPGVVGSSEKRVDVVDLRHYLSLRAIRPFALVRTLVYHCGELA